MQCRLAKAYARAMSVSDPAELDGCVANSWPPVESAPLGNWTLRASGGVTRRANSVMVRATDELSPSALNKLIEGAEDFYRVRGLPPIFQISDATGSTDLSIELAARGYTSSATTDVLHANCPPLVDAVDTGHEPRFSTVVEDAVHADWFDFYRQIESDRMLTEPQRSVFHDVLLRPRAPASFVSAHEISSAVATGQVAAIGQVVISNGLGCIQALGTAPRFRGRGAASTVVCRLAAEAKQRGATRLVAAVLETNGASQQLFARAGFIRSHSYCYFSAPST